MQYVANNLKRLFISHDFLLEFPKLDLLKRSQPHSKFFLLS